MKNPTRIIVAAVILCLALISVSCSSDGYPGTYALDLAARQTDRHAR